MGEGGHVRHCLIFPHVGHGFADDCSPRPAGAQQLVDLLFANRQQQGVSLGAHGCRAGRFTQQRHLINYSARLQQGHRYFVSDRRFENFQLPFLNDISSIARATLGKQFFLRR